MSRLLPSAALVYVLALLLLSPVGEAAAAGTHSTSSVTQRVSFIDQTGIRLQLRTTTPYDFGQVSPLAVANPGGAENVATIWSNASWRLQVRAAGPNFVESPTGTHLIPVGRLQVTGTTAAGGATAAILSTTDQQIATGAQTPAAGRKANINYRLQLLWSDPANTPGSSLLADARVHRRHPVTTASVSSVGSPQ